MTESNRQQRNAQPHRPGTGSVPVLFKLRNVQPNIVGGIASSTKTPATTTNGPTETSSPKIESTPVAATSMPAAQPAPMPAAAKSTRSFNVVVGLLVIALCLLVIRNTQSSKNAANTAIATNSAANSATSQTGLKPEANSLSTPPPIANAGIANSPNAVPKVVAKVEPFSSLPIPTLPTLPPITATELAEQKKPEDKPLELGSLGAPTQVPSANSMANLEINVRSPSNDTSKDPISLSGPINSAGASSGGSLEQNVVQAKPSLLLPSTKPEPAPSATPTLSFPDSRLAMNPAAGNTNLSAANSVNSPEMPSSSNLATRQGETANEVVDTVFPSLTTRELIEVRNRGTPPASSFNGQTYSRSASEPSVPASPISSQTNLTAAGTGNAMPNGSNPYQPISRATPSAYQPLPPDSTMLSGKALLALPQDTPAWKTPAYEQGASSGAQPSQSIRQPGASNSNRYPTTLAPQVPYTPVAPTQGVNSFGYPPGK